MKVEAMRTGQADQLREVSSLAQIDALILAGGLGTRLRTLIADRQKTIVDVSGRPFLEYLLDQLIESAVQRVILCIGHLADQVETHFGSRYHGLEIEYSREQALLGTAGALRFALPLIKSRDVLVLNGDSYCDADLGHFLGQHQARQSEASILLTEVEDTKRFGRVNIDEAQRITSFEEKGAIEGPGLINAGIYLLNTSLIREIPLGRNLSLERDLFPNWINRAFHGFPGGGGKFIDIGTPASYQQAQQIFVRGEK